MTTSSNVTESSGNTAAKNKLNRRALNILRLDSSPRYADSVSRHLTDHMMERLLREYPEAKVTTRDLGIGLPLPTEEVVDGTLYHMQKPTPAMQAAIQLSNEMLAELLTADIVVLGLPLYNWTVPSSFKAYIDHVNRPGVTFEYVDGVRRGLLNTHNVYIIFTSGGTGMGSKEDFATPYITYLWNTLGVQHVQFVEASGLLFNAEENTRNAKTQIDQLVLPVFA